MRRSIGTALLILLGDGVVAAVLLTSSKAQNSGWIVITWGWGMGVLFAVLAVGQFSGAHLNPAVTIGFAVIGNTDWSDVPKYLVGEFVGGVHRRDCLVWRGLFESLAGDRGSGAQARGVLDRPGDPQHGANLITEIIGTFVLLFGSWRSSANEFVAAPVRARRACFVGLLVLAIGLSLGGPTGYAINPARDLGPRIMHAILPIPGKGAVGLGLCLDPGRRPAHRRRPRRARVRRVLPRLIVRPT